ncbi:MAG: PH domain-containing protein, partial [Burkholderiaceae bacterium]
MQIYPEHELEAAPGLPEPLPVGERVLWQGTPDWKRLALEAFHLKRVALYFVLMLGLQAVLIWDTTDSLRDNLMPLLWSSLMAVIALGLLAFTAWM